MKKTLTDTDQQKVIDNLALVRWLTIRNRYLWGQLHMDAEDAYCEVAYITCLCAIGHKDDISKFTNYAFLSVRRHFMRMISRNTIRNTYGKTYNVDGTWDRITYRTKY